MKSEQQHLPRETTLSKLNELISWYEKFKPEAGKCIQVSMGPKALAKMLGKEFQLDAQGKPIIVHEWQHRGRTILAVGRDSS